MPLTIGGAREDGRTGTASVKIVGKRKARQEPLRVLHCPTTVGGHPQEIARAERELGLASHAVTFLQNRFEYETDEVLCDASEPAATRELKRWGLLLRALRQYDLIHYNFGQCILPGRVGEGKSSLGRWYLEHVELLDALLLSRMGKGVCVTYQGDDARQGDYCADHFEISMTPEVEPGYYTLETDRLKRLRIARMDRYADRIYALNPDLLHVLPERAEFLPYGNVDPRRWAPVLPEEDGPPVVLHAPSHRGAKGTRFIVDAVERLQGEGVAFEFLLVEGLSHREAVDLYGRADLLVDQLLAGWYGGLAVELMALGKPVICYVRSADLSFIPAGMRADLPIIGATPQTVYDVLKEWLTTGRGRLKEVGRRSRSYVEQWHDPLRIAARLKDDYGEIMENRRRRRRGSLQWSP